uniref:Protein NRT1/ PTR FAMILY 2.7 isoform X2 n=1 Tax=Elaeis guineensis var. tenera TaxID=51953 RepID=A0A6J0PDR1_ELAGV|nr:protein NRT1/ PTR FAMILY 2.7 isoform X2 [Elaeis guineensis]
MQSLILLTLTAALPTLRPSPCPVGSSICETPSAGQLALLYISLGLLAVGTGGTRFNTITMGADQFDKPRDRDIFFNWYFIGLYAGAVLGGTAIVYVQDSVSWALGFGLCAATSAISVIVLLLGVRFYHKPSAQGSPFTDLARVVVASIRKRRIAVPPNNLGYCYGPGEAGKPPSSSSNVPSQSFSFLNCAALISQGDTHPDGSIAKRWRLCTVQQVEDLKALIRISPLWTSGVVVSVLIATQNSLTVLQALTMGRSLGHHFTVPAGSLQVVTLTATAIFLSLLDRLLLPLWHFLTDHIPTPLQRIGVGHVLNAAAMAASALVERRRSAIVHARHAEGQAGWIVPMSALWLMLPLAMTGAAEALHFPGQVALYYQEFPQSLRSMATAMVGLIIAAGFYLSTAVVGLIRRATNWLPDNINTSRLEYAYWSIAVLGMINFGYYLLCANLYKYRRVADMGEPNQR